MFKVWKRPFSNGEIIKKLDIPRLYEERQRLVTSGGLSQAYPLVEGRAFIFPRHIKSRYDHLQAGEADSQIVHVGGRLLSFRELGSKLVFSDLFHEGERIQIIINANETEGFKECLETIQRGDVVEVKGQVSRTKRGELSVRALKLRLLAPCLQNIPDLHAPEMTEEYQSRYRHLNLLARPGAIDIFKKRSQIIAFLRKFMNEREFIEVETPILSTKAGGAMARPFSTQMEALDMPLSLRIAPELYLKKMIIAGFDRIYELGKVFRNEGIDSTHNPEFTSLEMYQSFASVDTMMHLAEELLHKAAVETCGDWEIAYQGTLLDLSGPFQRIDIVPTLESILNVTFDLEDSHLNRHLLELLNRHGVRYDKENRAASYLFDKLIGQFLEPLCQQPTFLTNHPIILSPLAAVHPQRPQLSSRFELFVAGREIMNGYSELNDPGLQRRRFKQQQDERGTGNGEAHPNDEDFVAALEIGMPPTAGCGIGVDRLVMLLSDKKHIRDVIFFPLYKPLNK